MSPLNNHYKIESFKYLFTYSIVIIRVCDYQVKQVKKGYIGLRYENKALKPVKNNSKPS